MLKRIFDPLNKIWNIFNSRQKVEFLSVLFGTIFYAIFEMLGVSIILPLVNAMLQPETLFDNSLVASVATFFHVSTNKEMLIMVIAGTVILYLIKNIYFAWFSWTKEKFACKIEREVSVYMLKSYMNRGYRFFLTKNTNEINQGVYKDVYNVFLILNQIMYAISKSLIVFFIGLYMFLADWKLAIAMIAAAAFCFLLVLLIFRKRMHKAGELERDYFIKAGEVLIQTIQGIKEVLVMRKQKSMINQYEENLIVSQKNQVKRQVGQDFPNFIIEAICVTVIMIVLGVRVLTGGNSASFIAVLASFAVGAFRIMPALGGMSSAINLILTLKPSLANVYENIIEVRGYNLEQYSVDTEDDERYCNVSLSERIDINNITFSYDENHGKVLDNLSLKIGKGKSIGLIGASGAGKSTLTDIVLGIIPPDTGDIFIDNVPIKSIPNRWSELIGFVPQTIYLCDASIKENVAFGVPIEYIDESKIEDALAKANILDFVAGLPDGINTEIGERGVRLSGGQRQRIGIARALYTNPQILILDEATSALDSDTENTVMEAIETLQGDVTMIIVAHRVTTLKNCDEIYEIKDGKAHRRQYDDLINATTKG